MVANPKDRFSRDVAHILIRQFMCYYKSTVGIPVQQCLTSELGHEKMCLTLYANNKCADQPALPRSLISSFVVHCLDSIISIDSIVEISRL